jgi:NADH-quinone oxidoreductase subunit L
VPTGASWVGLIIGAVIALVGIGIAYRLWVAKPGIPLALRARLGGLHTFLLNKWYFDELIDFLIVRPAAWFGRAANTVLEQIVIGGTITGGTSGVVRAGSAVVRRWQTGFLRLYAAAIIAGLLGVALYFLIEAS